MKKARKLLAMAVGLLVLTTLAVRGQSALDVKGKAAMAYKPFIPYPRLPDGSRPEGSGVFVCHIDTKTGRVKYVSVLKSTGSALLDKTGIEAFQRARFKAGTVPDVKVPIRWSHRRTSYRK
jgi:TonB family protein